jgi:hypothetical protein
MSIAKAHRNHPERKKRIEGIIPKLKRTKTISNIPKINNATARMLSLSMEILDDSDFGCPLQQYPFPCQ